MTNRARIDSLLLAGFCAFLFLYGLGQFGLIGADEPRYAQVAREMLERGDLITPVLGGHPWLEKPPLYYWQAMLAYKVLGVSDWAARLPSALDAIFLALAVYFFLRRFRPGFELDVALITASSAGIVGYARAASMDMALAATFTVAMLGWWAWRETGEKIYLAVFYGFMALGTLAKGPVAPFLTVVVIVLYAAAVREWRSVLRDGLAARNSSVLRYRAAVVYRGANTKSAVLSRIHRRTQSRTVLGESLPPYRTVLVLPASYWASPGSMDGVCDCGFGSCYSIVVAEAKARCRRS